MDWFLNMYWLRFSIFVAIATTASLAAKDFGCMGNVFSIEEESMLSFLQRKLSQGQQKIADLQQTIHEKARNPRPIQEIKYAKTARTFLFDSSMKVERDILDLKGHVLAKKDTRVNPLDHLNLSSGLLLFDGNLKSHITWAKNQQGTFKWILVKGKPIELEEIEKRPVFFDQTGISAHFKVDHYPARITQKGNRLLVEEIPIDDLGNPL